MSVGFGTCFWWDGTEEDRGFCLCLERGCVDKQSKGKCLEGSSNKRKWGAVGKTVKIY